MKRDLEYKTRFVLKATVLRTNLFRTFYYLINQIGHKSIFFLLPSITIIEAPADFWGLPFSALSLINHKNLFKYKIMWLNRIIDPYKLWLMIIIYIFLIIRIVNSLVEIFLFLIEIVDSPIDETLITNIINHDSFKLERILSRPTFPYTWFDHIPTLPFWLLITFIKPIFFVDYF